MRKIEYVVSNERLITPSGLSLVGQVLGKSNLIKKANRMRTEKRSQPQIKNGDILLRMIGLLALESRISRMSMNSILMKNLTIIHLASHTVFHRSPLSETGWTVSVRQ